MFRFKMPYNGCALRRAVPLGRHGVKALVMCGDSFIFRFIFALAGRLFWQLWSCGLILSG